MSIETLDRVEIKKWRQVAVDILDVDTGVSAFFTLSALRKRRWTSAISEGDFRDGGRRKYATTFATACAKLGFERAVCLDVDSQNTQGVGFELSSANLNEVHNMFLAPSYCIFEENGRFALISDSDYFWGLAGDQPFVDAALERQSSCLVAEVSETGKSFMQSEVVERRRLGANLMSYIEIIREAQLAY